MESLSNFMFAKLGSDAVTVGFRSVGTGGRIMLLCAFGK